MSELDRATRVAVLAVAMAAAEDVAISGYRGSLFWPAYLNGGYEELYAKALREAHKNPDGGSDQIFLEGIVDNFRKKRKARNAT